MLEKGYVDAVLAFMPDVSIFSERTNSDKAHLISISYDLIICLDPVARAAFVSKISQGLESMFRDGTVKQILRDMYLDYDSREFLSQN